MRFAMKNIFDERETRRSHMTSQRGNFLRNIRNEWHSPDESAGKIPPNGPNFTHNTKTGKSHNALERNRIILCWSNLFSS